MTVKRKALEVAAQELNFFLDPNPPINVKAKSDVLKQKVLEAGNLLEEGELDLSLSTETGLEGEELEARKTKIVGIQNTLKELGVKLFAKEKAEKEPEKTETVVEETENKTPKVSLTEMVQEAKKLVDLKVIVEAEDEFKTLREKLDEYTGLAGPRLLKLEMLKVLGAEVKIPEKKKALKEKKEKIKQYTRQDAVIDAIKTLCKKGANVSDITSTANDMYAKNGGKKLEKLQHMGNVTGHTLKALVAFNVLSQNEGIYQFVSNK